jgi:hypothetical protein
MCGKAMNASKIRHGAASFAQRGRGWLSEGADAAAAARRDASGRINEATDRVPETAGSTAAESRERMRAGTAALSDATTDAASRANEAMRDAAAAAGTAFGDTVSATYERAAAGAGRTASAVSDSASRIGNSAAASGRDLMDFCRDQPLVLAGLGLAVGAAIGAFLPRTQAEDQFMGGVSDELKEQGRGFAGEQFEKAKKVGERAFDAAQEEADRQGLAGEAEGSRVESREDQHRTFQRSRR